MKLVFATLRIGGANAAQQRSSSTDFSALFAFHRATQASRSMRVVTQPPSSWRVSFMRFQGAALLLVGLVAFAQLRAQPNFVTPYIFSTLAGQAASGDADGTGSAARFRGPYAVAVDNPGNVYVVDKASHTIRKITPAGLVTTFAGSSGISGSSDGTGSSARFSSPSGIAVDGVGNVYVADTDNATIRKITPAGVVTTIAGSAGIGGWDDGAGSTARFISPYSIAVDAAGNLYVTDVGAATIRKISAAGLVTTLAGTPFNFGSNDGIGSSAQFFAPKGIALDGAGNIYVAEYSNCTIRKITPTGTVTTLAGSVGNSGWVDGIGSAARFTLPQGLAVDGAGNVCVADSGTIRKISPTGVVSTFAGNPSLGLSADGPGNLAGFYQATGIAVDHSGVLYVADWQNYTIRKISTAAVVSTFAGISTSAGSIDGIPAQARFNQPFGVAFDGDHTVYVADSGNSSVRKITIGGGVTTLAGSPQTPGSADGTGGAAQFSRPTGITVDKLGNLYVADTSACTIRKITAAGVVTTLAGTAGVPGSTDGAGSIARFYYPEGVAVDGAGNVFVADTYNQTIRKITPAGVVSTFAGMPVNAGFADGTGSAARFNYPRGIAVDGAGSVYVADTQNNTIRKISPGGLVSTLPGLAGFQYPSAVSVDGLGNVYVPDFPYIRKITPSGVVSTLAGGQMGSADGFGDAVQFLQPEGLVVSQQGRLFVADTYNNTVREGVLAPPKFISGPATTATFGQSFSYAANFSGAPSSFGASGLPPGLMIDTSTGIISGVPTAAGSYTTMLTATNSAGSGSGQLTVVISKKDQTISFGSLASKIFGNAPFAIPCTVDSGLTPTLSVKSGPATLNGNAVTLTGAGTVVIRATQAGDNNYNPASLEQSFTVSKATATVTLGSLNAIYNGAGKAATATTSPVGRTVTFTYDGSTALPVFTGTYTVVGTIEDANYSGSATGSLVISKAVVPVTLTGLTTVFNGLAHPVSASTSAGIPIINLTYNLSSTPPTNAGSYAVVGTIVDPNYQGAGEGTLIISKATAVVFLGGLNGSFDGLTHRATATTTPSNLSVVFTYDGAAQAPTNAGNYAVIGTIVDSNYGGSAAGPLIIAKTSPTISWSKAAAISSNTALSPIQLNATANVAGNFSYTPGPGTMLNAGIHVIRVTFSPADKINYNEVFAQTALEVTASWPAAFDPQGYLDRNPDVGASIGDVPDRLDRAWQHYLQWGANEGRNFDDSFRVDEYLALNGDVAAAFGVDRKSAALHWLNYGKAEGRMGRVPAAFDAGLYLGRYGDLFGAFSGLSGGKRNVAAWEHYLDYGAAEGRSPDGYFDAHAYLATYDDLRAVFGNNVGAAVLHFYIYGRYEGRFIPAGFDVHGYFTRNPDVAAAFGADLYAGWLHYWNYGLNEGRVYDDLFRVDQYLAIYPDLQSAFGTDRRAALLHWLSYGRAEGRRGRF